ncbi:MAG: glycosyltransferase family 4 protein [Bacteroidales bacterium]|nr:glycosyltransferase family 4 protein [Bacteroidales bacterium]
MKILQLCYKPPFPPVDGGTLAMNSITRGLLSNGHKVKVLSVCSDKHRVSSSVAGSEYERETAFESVYIDLSVKPIDAAIAMLCGESYNIKRFISKDFNNKLSEILQADEYDIVHVESIFLAPYLPTIRKYSTARVVLRTHNVEHRIWRQLADTEKKKLKRHYLKHLALALRAYELDQINRFDGIACITDDDAETFKRLGCRKPVTVIPFGIDTPIYDNFEAEENTLFHIGSMDWQPNADGIRWFLHDVWPAVHHDLPNLKLFLAGRKMPDDLLNANIDGVNVVGEVPNATDFMLSKQINIVPLRAGGGMRIKIIEAMALGKTVVTTNIGASGIQYSDGENLLIANTPEEFMTQLKRCTLDKELLRRIGDNARALVKKQYSNQAITTCLTQFYDSLIQ